MQRTRTSLGKTAEKLRTRKAADSGKKTIASRKKKVLLDICWVMSIIFAIFCILFPVLLIISTLNDQISSINEMLLSYVVTLLLYILCCTQVIFLVFLIIQWNKRKDKFRYLFYLICFNVFYCPFYYFRIRNKLIR